MSLATATPAHDLPQDVVAENAGELFAASHGGLDRLAPIFRNAAIETRQVSAPVDWFLSPHSFSERNDLFLETAVDLLAQAASKAMAQAGLQPADIDTIVTVCSTGVATPALDARLSRACRSSASAARAACSACPVRRRWPRLSRSPMSSCWWSNSVP